LFQPFVDICLKYKNITEAKKYLVKVRDEVKIMYYVRAEQLDEAVGIAVQQRDPEALRYVLNNGGAHNAELAAKINRHINQLLAKK